MNTRIATRSDADLLLPALEAFSREDEIQWNPGCVSGLGTLLQDATLGFVLIAEHEGRLCGYAILTYGFDLEFGGRDSYLTEFYLSPAVRGRGFGKQLLDAVERNARDNGANAMHLCVRPENVVAINTYRRAGFVRAPRDLFTKTL